MYYKNSKKYSFMKESYLVALNGNILYCLNTGIVLRFLAYLDASIEYCILTQDQSINPKFQKYIKDKVCYTRIGGHYT